VKCVDPFCKEPHPTTFELNEKKLEAWLEHLTCNFKIQLTLGKRNFVCFKHFKKEHLVESKARTSLHKDAVPQIFPDRPPYLQLKIKRSSLEKRLANRELKEQNALAEEAKAKHQEEKTKKKLEKDDCIQSFQTFLKEVDEKLPADLRKRFNLSVSDESISFNILKRNIDGGLCVFHELRVHSKMNFNFYSLGVEWTRPEMTSVVGLKRKIDTWTVLRSALEQLLEIQPSPQQYCASSALLLKELEAVIEMRDESHKHNESLKKLENQTAKLQFLQVLTDWC
jgi:hypothetical protein